MKKQLKLPRVDKEGNSYISYSQLNTWNRSKREYMRQYFYKESFEGNAYTEFGTKVGEALENNDFSEFTKTEQKFLKTVPRYDEFEKEIKLEMKGFYVKGYIDSNTVERELMVGSGATSVYQDTNECILDYKTGDIEKKRSEYESDDYKQLDIYAAAIEQDTGHLPTDVKVVLIGRSGNAFKREELKLTNEYAIIDKDVNPERIADVLQWVQETTEEISKYYEVFLKLKQITNE